MSGLYPPPGRPGQPGHGGWPGERDPASDGPPTLEFPVAGEATPTDGRRPGGRRGRVIAVVLAVMILIGGACAAMFLVYRHSLVTGVASPASGTSTSVSPGGSAGAEDDGVTNGATTLILAPGACVSASVLPTGAYAPGGQVTCGTPSSDLVLAKTTADEGGCPARDYLRIQAATTVYCFTLDVKAGDCLDSGYLKVACGSARYPGNRGDAGRGGAKT